jgi:hypothetical protein
MEIGSDTEGFSIEYDKPRKEIHVSVWDNYNTRKTFVVHGVHGWTLRTFRKFVRFHREVG